MNFDELVELEKKNLEKERLRLAGNLKQTNKNISNPTKTQQIINEICPVLLQTSPFAAQCNKIKENVSQKANEPIRCPPQPTTDLTNTKEFSPIHNQEKFFICHTVGNPEMDTNTALPYDDRMQPVDFQLNLTGLNGNEDEEEKVAQLEAEDSMSIATPILMKAAKNMVNQQESLAQSARTYNEQFKENNVITGGAGGGALSERSHVQREKDDMEQWVTDTFYSYFPGFNNENQKRQSYLRERQRENQQNFLKHQMLNPASKAVNKIAPAKSQTQFQSQSQSQSHTARSSTTSSNATGGSINDKTELEIIVNNPNYVPPKSYAQINSSRVNPGTARHKLLQDLGHVELSNIVTGDGIMERNMRSAELEIARKKDYQRDLMQQIEEKRRSIELMREKERKQEEALTRRLESQLKTIQLEEQLEKERLRDEKIRIDAEHNRLMRDHLLTKLKNDSELLNAKQKHYLSQQHGIQNQFQIPTAQNEQLSSNTKLQTKNKEKDTKDHTGGPGDSNHLDNNKVYKYFSNSARHEYKRGQPLPKDVELLDFEFPEMTKIERECFHLCDKICPLCDEPLKSYESCCLRCQRKMALKLKKKRRKKKAENSTNPSNSNNQNEEHNTNNDDGDEDDVGEGMEDDEDDDDDDFCRTTYALVCLKCERLYALCPVCLAKSDVCRACHRKRNVCLNCRRTLCAFCLEEIACGKDTERIHINDLEKGKQKFTTHNNNNSGEAFHVLEVNYNSPENLKNAATPVSTLSPPSISDPVFNHTTTIYNKLTEDKDKDNTASSSRNESISPPYTVNIVNKPAVMKKSSYVIEELPSRTLAQIYKYDVESSSGTDDHNIERVRRDTDKRLSRYLKNYGDLAVYQQRSKSESRNRSTQTTPLSSGRRDVVMRESTHNLSMPLLREMPKMTRKETTKAVIQGPLNNQQQQQKIDNLKSRWEVPAVQKLTVSTTSPKILTQVGAIRKQLQADRLLTDEHYFKKY